MSVGRKGAIPKIVQYSETNLNGFYNLGFGDKSLQTDEVDDAVISDNGDRQKVLATVAATVYAFTDRYPTGLDLCNRKHKIADKALSNWVDE